MPKRTKRKLDFGKLGRCVIEADFSGGDLSTEGARCCCDAWTCGWA